MKKYLYRLATDQENGFVAAPLKGVLLLLSVVYWAALGIVRLGYRSRFLPCHRVGKPVISIGNITMGGVGKTPLVEMLARYLKERKLKPAVLIRGYMDNEEQGQDLSSLLSDEANLLDQSLGDVPVLVGRDRVRQAELAMQTGDVGVFILDDGFQHWRLHRDLDIVVIDATNPFGNGRLIPRGTLREPLGALSRADMFVLTKTDAARKDIDFLAQRLRHINSKAPIVETVHEPVVLRDLRGQNIYKDLSYLRGKAVCGFCGIGDPRSFTGSLLALGADVKKNFSFMDHHLYTEKDIEQISRFCRDIGIDTVVTTEKDAVKLQDLLNRFDKDITVLSLKIRIRITKGQDEFFGRITNLLRR